MKGTARSVFSLLLCTIAAGPFIFCCCFTIYRLVIRYEAREALEQKESITITIPTHELVWIEKGKELMIEGEMFDVGEYKIHGDSVMLTGLYDKDETLIIKKLNQVTGNTTNSGKETTLVIFKWFSCFASAGYHEAVSFSRNESLYHTYILISDKLSASFRVTDSPPPWIYFS